jgi:hypothetical protein
MTRTWIATLALAGVLAACDTIENGETFGLDASPPPAGTWITIETGGDTRCARGDAYRFFVRGGDPSKVIIDFQGGGACWNAQTCGFADQNQVFSQSTGSYEGLAIDIENGQLGGLFDPAPDDPLADFTFVHIPYCTGDIHWGNAEQTYREGAEPFFHNGFVNAQAALRWVYDNYDVPENILVSGCSAGAYGAALHSAYVRNQYPDARVSVLADSGAGIITETFLDDSLPNWNAEASLPTDFVPALDVPLSELSLNDLYIEIGRAFPDMRLAQTATEFDDDQRRFFLLMGGDPQAWNERFREGLDTIRGATPNFTSYVSPGPMHCVSPYPFYYDRTVNGVALRDWVNQLVNGDRIPEPEACEGEACCQDPICDACLATPFEEWDDWCQFCLDWPFEVEECAEE